MTQTFDLSQDLVEWAQQAGYQVTQGSTPARIDTAGGDDRSVVWANNGEIRYFIGQQAGGWYIVTSSDRMAPEELVFAAESMDMVELYFYGKCGLSIRSSLSLPILRYPRSADEVAAGYGIGTATLEGRESLALIDAVGSPVAITASGKIVGTAELVCLSYYLASSVEALKASYLDPSGRPLFTVRES